MVEYTKATSFSVLLTSLLCFFQFSGLSSRSPVDTASVHVINIDIQDNHEEATIGAFLFCELAALVGLTEFFTM